MTSPTQTALAANASILWLHPEDWQSAFPHICAWASYSSTLPQAVLAKVCAARCGQPPARVLVEQPWQAQWVSAQCVQYLAQHGISSAPLPQVLTLAQWVAAEQQWVQSIGHNTVQFDSQSNSQSDPQTVAKSQPQYSTESPTISERQAALALCAALTSLTVDSIRSDAARYSLACEMVSLLKEIDLRAQLSPSLTFAGQQASERLDQSAWLSREGSWLAAARHSLSTMGKPLAWQLARETLLRLAQSGGFAAVLPAVHPGLSMQVFLSFYGRIAGPVAGPVATESSADDLASSIAQSAFAGAVCVPHVSRDGAVQAPTVVACESFEHEAQSAAQLLVSLVLQTSDTLDTSRDERAKGVQRQVVVVANDRVLGRRCAALLARAQIPVEDRVGWALSTTVSATVLRSVLTSWQGSDVLALLGWLGLPVVAAYYPHAQSSASFLQALWHTQVIVPQGAFFLRYAAQSATDDGVQALLHDWHEAHSRVRKPQTTAQFAAHLIDFLQVLAPALQADAAGAKVWQQLLALAGESDVQPISLATFIAVLDQVLEAERYSASTHSHDAASVPKIIFAPLYEAAWTGDASVVLLACNEAHFPAAPRNPSPLLGSVRRELGLPMPTPERAVWQHLLAQPKQTMLATFTPSEQGNPSRLSPWLLGANVRSAAPLEGQAAALAHAYAPATTETAISPALQTRQAAAVSLPSLPSEVSVSALAALIQCPYRFALQAALKVRPLSEPAHWPTHRERGNFLHEALHAAQAQLGAVQAPEQLETAIGSAMARLLSQRLPLSGRYGALAADSQRTVSTYVSAHMQRQQEGWRIHAAEHALETFTLLEGTRVHGKIDRLDAIFDAAGKPQAYAVLDYKTSNEATLKAKREDALLDAQLALYAAVLEQLDCPTAQAAYWRLHDGLYDAAVPKTDYHSKKTVLELVDLPLQIDSVQATVRRAWDSLAKDSIALATPSAHACQHCPYTAVCRSSDLAALIEASSDE